jgi:hypothetical protein
LGDELFVFEDVVGDAPGIHGGVVEELEPVVRALFEAELPGPGAKGVLVARRREDFALELAPVFSFPWKALAEGDKLVCMKTNGDAVALEKFLRPMARGLSIELARAIVNLAADEETQSRYDLLAEKNSEGQITPAEREELESLVRVNTLLGVLKVEAQAVLDKAA